MTVNFFRKRYAVRARIDHHVTVTVAANSPEEAKHRFEMGAWHGVDCPDYDRPFAVSGVEEPVEIANTLQENKFIESPLSVDSRKNG